MTFRKIERGSAFDNGELVKLGGRFPGLSARVAAAA
jgi:hypothetical protein